MALKVMISPNVSKSEPKVLSPSRCNNQIASISFFGDAQGMAMYRS